MSYPNIRYGDFGDEKVAASVAPSGNPLGQLMILPDGSKFRLARASSAAALSAGTMVSSSAAVVGHGGVSGSGLLASATTTENLAGHTVVYLVSKSAAVTLDQYAGGWLNVQGPAASSYIGYKYRIKENASAAVSTRFKITLDPKDSLKVDFKAGTTSCSLHKSQYSDAIVRSTSAAVAPIIGGVPTAVSANFYFWAQRTGLFSAIQSATACTDGAPVISSSVTSGSVTVASSAAVSTSVWEAQIIGVAKEAPAASTACLIDLMLE